jgi:hypothetical protein
VDPPRAIAALDDVAAGEPTEGEDRLLEACQCRRGRAPKVKIALSPEPIPSTARPRDTASMLVMALAVTTRCRVNGLVTRGPTRARVVPAAARVSATYSS